MENDDARLTSATLAPSTCDAFDPFVPQAYRVAARHKELPDVVTLELQPLARARPAFAPGQFNMLYAFGVGEAAISMSGDPAAQGAFVHTIRDVAP